MRRRSTIRLRSKLAPLAAVLIAAALLAPAPPGDAAASPHPVPVKSPSAPTPWPASSTPPVRALSPDELVRDAIEAPHRISYVGEQSTIRWGTTGATATVTRVEHRAPDLTRRVYLAPHSVYGDYTISQGSRSYEYDVSASHVTYRQNNSLNERAELEDKAKLLSANYRLIEGPREIIAGHATISLSLVNRYTGVRMDRVWIDEKTKLILGNERYHADGAIASRRRFDDIRYTANIPLGLFTPVIPAGYKQSQSKYNAPSTDVAAAIAKAGFSPYRPALLPDGFSLVGAEVTTVKGVRSLHLVYSDGLRNLSLFENNGNAAADFGSLHATAAKVEKNDGAYVKDGPTTLLAWREHGLSFALVGDLEVHELQAIAGSVVPDD